MDDLEINKRLERDRKDALDVALLYNFLKEIKKLEGKGLNFIIISKTMELTYSRFYALERATGIRLKSNHFGKMRVFGNKIFLISNTVNTGKFDGLLFEKALLFDYDCLDRVLKYEVNEISKYGNQKKVVFFDKAPYRL